MTHRIKFAVIACSMALVACAHAQAATGNLCPAGTKTVGLIQDSSIPDAPLEVLPYEGAFGETPVKKFDISGATGQFKVQCNPNPEGFAGQTTWPVPLGSKACTFDSAAGVFTCQ